MANWQCAWSLGVALGVISLSLQNLSAQQIESLQAEAPSGLLERVVTLRMEGELPLHLALEAIGESIGVKFTLDKRALVDRVAEGEEPRFPAPNGRRKASEHLERLLDLDGLVAVALDGNWVITTEDRAFHLQMRQKVDVAWDKIPLEKALQDLAKAKGLNVVIDPRQGKFGKTTISLQLKGATLEAALRLAAELGGLMPVPVGNVIFLTNATGAKSLRSGGDLLGQGGEFIPAGLFEPERFTGPAPALPPLLPVPNARPAAPGPPPAVLPAPGPAAPPPGGPPAGAPPFFNERGPR